MKRIATIVTAAVIAMGAASAQTSIGSLPQSEGVTIRGEVTEVFGNKFVLRDATGRVLVETGPHWYHRIEVKTGETVTVTGRPEANGGFDAFTVQRGNSAPVEIRRPHGPPPWAGKKHHALKGASASRVEPAVLSEASLRQIVERGGYKYGGSVDRKPKHYEVLAENPHGEQVELHIDFGGTIYKEERRFGGR